MCLYLKYDEELKVAEKDIICYKFLKYEQIRFLVGAKHGAEFTGIIGGKPVQGIMAYDEDDERWYLLTNNDSADGAYGKWRDHFGYKYSWIFDIEVESIVIDGKEIICYKYGYLTPYQDVEVKIGETYESRLIKEGAEVYTGLHSFECIEDIFPSIIAGEFNEYIIVECIIPKGSKYYCGTYNDAKSFASSKITYMKIVE